MGHCDPNYRCAGHGLRASTHYSIRRWAPIAFSFSSEFFGTKEFVDAHKCRCQFHSNAVGYDVWIDTNWNREDEGLGSERYEVKGTASAKECQTDHGGATDDRIITKAQWENAAPGVTWDFFPNI